ncbi:acyltransferase family protein [Streptomyces sp. NPDC059918]|uniref:acyltransferase family protein n=1 Tax=unclassified Streptomyces TaxID=2593676 RepID=UPI003660E7C6
MKTLTSSLARRKAAATPDTTTPGTAPGAGARLGWLDALRGIAALVVVLHHFDVLRMLPFGGTTIRWNFDLGLFGVMLFFIVSGYIIPASLERRGDVRGFWIGRLFRIYPAVIAAFAAAIMMLPAGDGSVALLRTGDDLASLVANGLMLQDMLGVINGMNVTWTLCYEMVFYFFVTALFTRNLHRHSAPIAVGFAGAALAIGTALAPQLLTGFLSVRQLLLIVTPIVLAGFWGVLSGNRKATAAGALLLGALGLVLAALNSRAVAFETLMIFATMFAGTVVYRAQHGTIGRVPALLACGSVVVAGVLVGWLYNRDGVQDSTWTSGWKAWSFSYLAAWVLFGLFFLLRGRHFPKPLTWLGAISFSMYLLHFPLLRTIGPPLGVPPVPASTLGKIVWTAVFLAALMAASHVMYRLVELPAQRLGKRIQRAADGRRPAAAAAGPDAVARTPEGDADSGPAAAAAAGERASGSG